MDTKIKCPKCGHSKFSCSGSISANLIAYNDDGSLEYILMEWDDVESVEYFSCRKCDYEFEGNEEEFLEHLKQKQGL